MRVLFLQQQPCVRALKYAVALRDRHPSVRLAFAYRGATLSGLYSSGDELFEQWFRLGEPLAGSVARALTEFRPDVVHAHNLPDLLTVLALEVADGRVPVVHDVHDLQSLRRTPYEDGFPEPPDPAGLEQRAVEGAAAVVTVSDELLAELAARYRLPPRTLTFPNYALGRDLPRELPPADRPRADGFRLVYQGTLAANGGHYDLRHVFRQVAGAGMALDVFPNRPLADYNGLGVRLQAKLAPAELLATLPRYDFGWAGFNAALNAAHLDTVLPNKAFEYVGCGLPVVTFRHKALARLVDERGLGIVIDDVGELAERLAALDHAALRSHVAALRFDFTVETRISELAELYEALV